MAQRRNLPAKPFDEVAFAKAVRRLEEQPRKELKPAATLNSPPTRKMCAPTVAGWRRYAASAAGRIHRSTSLAGVGAGCSAESPLRDRRN